MAKSVLSLGASISTFVSQIAAGNENYSIAVEQGIRFFDGQTDESGVLWNGSAPLEVVIPTLADIVTNPVRLIGTVDASGVIDPVPTSNKDGDLVYITADCTFEGIACEAGDMAVYANGGWHVISGENQVSLAGGTVDASGNHSVALSKSAVKVLDVEGKELSLAIDYSDVRNNTKVTKNEDNTINVANGTVTVDGMYIGLSQADGSTTDITTSVSIDLPSALADGTVTIDPVLEASNFVFTSGAYPTAVKNSASISVSTSHSMTIAASGEGSFVTDVTAIKGVSFATATSASHQLAYVSDLSASDGSSFVDGVHVRTNEDGEAAADFSAWGEATVSVSTFVSGLSAEAASGDVVSSITVGAVTLGEGSDILTGLSNGGDSVLTDVSFGTLGIDTAASWFFSGLSSDGTDVVTDVTVGAVSIVSDANSTFAGSAITTASVNNHVLSFTTGAFMTPISLSKASDTITKGGFTKSGVQLSGTGKTSDVFTKGAISQAATSVSFKSVLTDNVVLSQSQIDYFFDKSEATVYSPIMGYVSLSVSDATVTKSGAILENKEITAYIPASQVAVDVTEGTLPTFAVNAATGSISGSVSTSLTTSNISWLAVDSTKKDIAIAGAWSLVEDSTIAGAIQVAAASTYGVDNATVTIASNTYVESVIIDGTAVGVSSGE